ncbi:hypothetical protein ABH940_006596 [Streptacidiphilus sp. BW17]
MAEGLELADEVAGLAGFVEVAAVPLGTEVLVGVAGSSIRCHAMTRIERATATTAFACPRRLTMRR